MRLAILRVLAVYLSSAALVVTQSQTEDPGPSPAASIGCVPHNDHWDCEGPRVTSSIITMTSAIPAASESTHDESAPVTGSTLDPGPSPTASIGCVPHGDHWDCEGPAPASAASSSGSDSGIVASATPTATTAPAASESTHDENAPPVTGSTLDPGPSPTASIGCVAHGDHWDCEGPAPASAVSSSGSNSGILVTASATASVNSSANAVAAGTSGSRTSSAPAQYTGAGSVVSLERHFVAALEAGVLGFGVFLAAA